MSGSNDLFADIWGSPDKPTSSKRSEAPESPSQRRASSSSSRLFHSDDDDDDGEAPIRRPGKAKLTELPPDVEALFPQDDSDDDDDRPRLGFAPVADLESLAREAEARHAKANPPTRHPQPSQSQSQSRAAGSGSGSKNDPFALMDASGGEDASKGGAGGGKTGKDEKKKEKKPIPKLDENRLLGEHGFRALLPKVAKLELRGRGASQKNGKNTLKDYPTDEAANLAQVMEMYQMWSHRMFPKMQFRDTAERVEKLCHSRRMMSSLSVWKDEAKNGPRSERGLDVDENEDEADAEAHTRDYNAEGRPMEMIRTTGTGRSSSPPVVTGTGRSSSPASSVAPSIHSSGDDIDDAELDELMATMERTQPQSRPGRAPPSSVGDIDDDMWDMADEMDAGPSSAPSKPPAAPKRTTEEDDADMWADMADVVDDSDLMSYMDDAPSLKTTKGKEKTGGPGEPAHSLSQSASPTVNNATDKDDDAAAASMSMDIDGEGSSEQVKKRRASMREEFDEGWDDMYE